MLPKTFGPVIVLLVLLLHVFVSVNCYSGSATLKTKRNSKGRQQRLLGLITDPQLNFYFEYNSCYALAAVISIPLELPASRSTFFSYNFETNYYYAYFDNAQGLTPISFSHITEPGTNTGSLSHKVVFPNSYGQFDGFRKLDDDSQLQYDSTNSSMIRTEESSGEKVTNNLASDIKTSMPESKEAKKSKKKQTTDEKDKLKNRKIRGILQNYFMSRRRFFKMMENKMDSSGLNGRECLLKAICQTAADTFGQHNGVIGSVVDVLFLPSASKDEKLPKKYYEAEANGKLRNCNVYDKMCSVGLFDFISKII